MEEERGYSDIFKQHRLGLFLGGSKFEFHFMFGFQKKYYFYGVVEIFVAKF